MAQDLDRGSITDVHPIFALHRRAIESGFRPDEFDTAVAAAVDVGLITVVSDCGPRGAGYFMLATKSQLYKSMAQGLINLLATVDGNNDQHPDWVDAVCKAREALPPETAEILKAMSVDARIM